ncbi:MAG: phosphocholine cytidylyltransferase family protein [Leptospirales bacterium]|nr:phosphocholine cytidylyltransferase family protein [Leptospirales bacterium]
MIKTAVIMAAGTGSRFGAHTETKPKGFVSVGCIPMIVRSIENLLSAGIEKIIIGTGHQSSYYEDLANKYPQIVCCKSDKYAETNSMYTLYCCADLIGNDDFLLLESDLIYERKALLILIDSEYSDAMLVTSFTKQQDGYYLFADDEGIVSDCTTDAGIREKCKGELVGIHKISNRTYQKMRHWYGGVWRQQPKLGYEYAMIEMSRQGSKIHVLKEDNLFWYEIDDETDLLFAEKNIIHRLN